MKSYMKNSVLNRIVSSILALTLVMTGMYIQSVEADAAEDVEVVSSVGQTYVECREISDYVGKSAPKPTKEEYADWLFSGWYTDAACQQEQIISDTTLSGKYYAKFVPEEVLSVKFQLYQGTTEASETTQMRLLSTVDSLAYSRVGFKIEIDSISYAQTVESNKVYTQINAKEGGVTFSEAPSIFQFSSSKYFVTATVAGIPQTAFGSDIRVTPYWKTMDGAVVYGVGRTVRVADSYQEVVNVPVRVYSDKTLTANDTVTVSYDPTMYTYAGMAKGTLIDTAAITVNSDTAGQVVCTVNDTIGTGITADGMLANLRFTKNAAAGTITVDDFKISSTTTTNACNPTCEVYHNLETAVTDGIFTAEELVNYGDYYYGRNVDANVSTRTITLTEDNTAMCYINSAGNNYRTITVENAILNTAEYNEMTIKIKSTDTKNVEKEFDRWCLHINPDLSEGCFGTELLAIDTGSTSDSAYDSSVLSVSKPDKNKWITVTFHLDKLPMWVGAETIKGFTVGGRTTGQYQEIAEIKFTKTGDTQYEDVFTGEKLKTATACFQHSATNEAKITETVTSTGVQYNFGTLIAQQMRTMTFDNYPINADDYTKMIVKMKDMSGRSFERFRIYYNQSVADGKMANSTNFYELKKGLTVGKTGTSYTDTKIAVSEPDADGWFTVTIHLDQVSNWTGNLTGFGFGYICKSDATKEDSNTQEIAYIKLERATSKTISADSLYKNAEVYHNSDVNRPIPATLQDTGVKYDFLDYRVDQLKSIYLGGLNLDPNEYSRISFRIRSLSTAADDTRHGFTMWRCYINSDSSIYNTSGTFVDGEGRGNLAIAENDLTPNKAYTNATGSFDVTAPDENGWVTVTMDMGSVAKWCGATTITGIHLAYVNAGAYQEIEGITFDSSKDTNGIFAATYLKQYGIPVHGSSIAGLTEYPTCKSLSDTGLEFGFNTQIGGYKGIKLSNLNLQTEKYDTMRIRLRSHGDWDYVDYGLGLVTDANEALTEVLAVDSLGNDALIETEKDEDGWRTVIIDLNEISAWTTAETVTGFCFVGHNYDLMQEIAEIKFDKTSEFSYGKLYNLGTPYTAIETLDQGTEKLVTGGLENTFNEKRPGSLKAIYVDNVDFISGRYDTLTIKMKDTTSNPFTRWRLYVNQDVGSQEFTSQLADSNTIDGTTAFSSSDGKIEVTAPDENGWVTVTFHLDKMNFPETVENFVIGYVNTKHFQIIESAKFTFEGSVQLIYPEASSKPSYMQLRYPYLLKTQVPGLENATYSTTASDTARNIQVVENSSLAKGTATIAASGGDVTCTVADYYGFAAVLDYFKNYGFVLADGSSVTVAHTDNISGVESSTAYADSKTGEYRVMSYNIEWSSHEGGTAVSSNEQRNELQAKMIAQYMPDILGLQERGMIDETYGTRSGINALLEGLGYQEAITYQDEAARNQNFTPLWYNANTMNCVESGYATAFTKAEDLHWQGKGYTWAILRSKTNPDDLMLAVNTHMHTGGGVTNKAQAEELQAVIDEVLATKAGYESIPVLMLGDLNSLPGTKDKTDTDGYDAYEYFTIDKKYTNPVVPGSGAAVSNKTRTNHSRVVTINDPTLGEVLTRDSEESVVSNYNGTSSVDHILFSDITNLILHTFGVVVDDITNSTSDHYPIFTDFTIN